MRIRITVILILVLALGVLAPVSAQTNVIDLGTLGGSNSNALGVNNRGQVVGEAQLGVDFQHPFLWDDGVMIDLGNLGSTSVEDETSRASAINDVGQVVGTALTATERGHAFLWEKGVMVDLGTLGGSSSGANAINNQGQIVGGSSTSTGEYHAFLWENGAMVDLGTLGGNNSNAAGINDRGQVVGSSTTANGERHAFLWEDGMMFDLGTLGAQIPWSHASAINNNGQIVGYSRCDQARSDCSGGIHTFLWDDGTMIDLLDLTDGGTFGEELRASGSATAINNRGQITLSVPTLDGNAGHAVVWTNGQVADLGVGTPHGLNEHGQTVGHIQLQAVLWDSIGGSS